MRFRIVAIIALVLSLTAWAAAQSRSKDENELRRLEQQQVDLLLRGDVKQMEAAWLPEFTVNNPFLKVVNGHEGPVRKGKLTYSSFIRNVEKIVLYQDTAAVMGNETVVPSGASDNAGKEIKRRFTNFWIKSGGKWKMLARHASVICKP